MKPTDIFQLHGEMCAKALTLMRGKNRDYAGAEDGLKNYTQAAQVAGITLQQVLVSRMADKMARLGNVSMNGNVTEETVEDTLLDLINFCVLIAAARRKP